MSPRYVVLADDFTGACDTALQFLHSHNDLPRVLLDPENLRGIAGSTNVLVVDTETRNLPAEEAFSRIAALAAELHRFVGTTVFYLKTDSTLRGNTADEVEALQQGLGLPTAVFAPAFPKMGRTVKDGILSVEGTPVSRTAMARDPLKPVTTSDISLLLRGAGACSPRHVHLEELRGGFLLPPPGARCGNLREEGRYTFDAETDEDLRRLVRAVTASVAPETVLWAGSAGLAEALVRRDLPVLAVVGSVHPRSIEQVRHVLDSGTATGFTPDMGAFLRNVPGILEETVDAVGSLLLQGRNVLIASSRPEDPSSATHRGNDATRIAAFLGDLTCTLVRRHRPGGLFLSGGDVAAKILKQLSVVETVVTEEIEPGIPLLRVHGGNLDGLPLVTKAGAFGTSRSIAAAILRLRG